MHASRKYPDFLFHIHISPYLVPIRVEKPMNSPFLTAEWRKLAMANYSVDAALLKSYVPNKTELDLWNNTCYVSLVGFMFLNTRLKGFSIPFHTHFEEVNLRFYVRYRDGQEWKRGVVFIKEIVPRPALTWVANTVYHEKYETMPMKHTWHETRDELTVTYAWKKETWNSFEVKASTATTPIRPGSDEEFITEHYWGYTQINPVKTSEYRVEHPTWEVYPVRDYHIDVRFGEVYGMQFDFLTSLRPASVFLAEGSAIQVQSGKII
jgi:uncharacterized protein YqjF (DUF2071 family)